MDKKEDDDKGNIILNNLVISFAVINITSRLILNTSVARNVSAHRPQCCFLPTSLYTNDCLILP